MSVITLTELKNFMGIKGTDQDTQLQFAVDGVNSHVLTETGRVFGTTRDITDELHDYSPTVWLDNQDITVLTSVTIGRTSPDTLDSDDYFWNEQGRLVLSTRVSHNPSKNDFDVVGVTYTHGVATVPDDLKYAALQAGAEMYNGIDGEVTEESVGSYRRVYKSRENSRVSAVLNAYKRIRL